MRILILIGGILIAGIVYAHEDEKIKVLNEIYNDHYEHNKKDHRRFHNKQKTIHIVTYKKKNNYKERTLERWGYRADGTLSELVVSQGRHSLKLGNNYNFPVFKTEHYGDGKLKEHIVYDTDFGREWVWVRRHRASASAHYRAITTRRWAGIDRVQTQVDFSRHYRRDGTLERHVNFGTDEGEPSRWEEHYHPDGRKETYTEYKSSYSDDAVFRLYYRPDHTYETHERYDDLGEVYERGFYDAQDKLERVEGYHPDGGELREVSLYFYRADEILEEVNVYDADSGKPKQKKRYRADGKLEEVDIYDLDNGELSERQYYAEDGKTLFRAVQFVIRDGTLLQIEKKISAPVETPKPVVETPKPVVEKPQENSQSDPLWLEILKGIGEGVEKAYE